MDGCLTMDRPPHGQIWTTGYNNLSMIIYEKYLPESVLLPIFLASLDHCPRKTGYSEVFYIPLKALDSFFYHATDLNEVFFNP